MDFFLAGGNGECLTAAGRNEIDLSNFFIVVFTVFTLIGIRVLTGWRFPL